MSRSRVIFYVFLGLGLLIVGSQAVFASTDGPHSSVVLATATATPTATAHPNQGWNIAGTIQAMNGEFWNVQGFAIRVTSDTRITGDLPTIGDYVQASGVVQSDGTWLATDLHVGHDSPTATPTSQPTSTSTNTATLTATATATPSPSATPTATPTVVIETATPDLESSFVTPVGQDDDDSQSSDHHNPKVHPNKGRHGAKGDAREEPSHDAGHRPSGDD